MAKRSGTNIPLPNHLTQFVFGMFDYVWRWGSSREQRNFEETDFCLRAKRAGFSTWYVPESRVMHIAGQSTKVTERNTPPKRLPAYWFESRRRYVTMAYGVYYAMAVDIVAFVAHGLGALKRLLQRRADRGTPHYLADLMQHGVLRRRNREVRQIRNFMPRS